MHKTHRLVIVSIVVSLLVQGAMHAQLPSFATPYVTRAEAVMILLQERLPYIPNIPSNGDFTDVKKGSWYERYVVIGDRLGIIQSHPVTRRIRPDDPVTRAEFLSMATRTFGISVESDPSYSDVPLSAWYSPAAAVAQSLKLFPGDRDQKSLKPDEYMVHGETAKAVQILVRAWKGNLHDANTIVALQPSQLSLIKAKGPSIGAGQSVLAPPVLRYSAPSAPAGSDLSQLPRLRQDVLGYVNARRREAGLQLLRPNAMLEVSAQKYAAAMVNENFFGHVSPSGQTLKQRMEESGYYKPFFQSDCLCVKRYLMGENLARGQRTAKEVVDNWMQSPSHRAAIMNPLFSETGVGIKAGIWVQHFGGEME